MHWSGPRRISECLSAGVHDAVAVRTQAVGATPLIRVTLGILLTQSVRDLHCNMTRSSNHRHVELDKV